MAKDLKPWIARALLAGRKPLPDAAPKRPPISKPIPKPIPPFRTKSAPPSAHAPPKCPEKIQRRPWTPAEIRHLFRLKDRDLSWEAIQSHLPGRSVDAIKQTFWKHRLYLRNIKAARKKRLRMIQDHGTAPRLDTIAEEGDAQSTAKIGSPAAAGPVIQGSDIKENDGSQTQHHRSVL